MSRHRRAGSVRVAMGKLEDLLLTAHRAGLRWPANARVEVTHHDITVPALPPALEGFTLAHISDLHIGTEMPHPSYLSAASKALEVIRPDVLVNSGDFLRGEADPELVFPAMHALSKSAHVDETRSFTVLGNHDYVEPPETVRALMMVLERSRTRILANELVEVVHRGGVITLSGLTDEAPGLDAAVQRLQACRSPRVVLLHVPELAERLPAGCAELVLAGHSHGGQVTLPRLERYIVRRFAGTSYVAGLYRINGLRVYVNRGLGCTGPPVRFRAPPEVAVFRLFRAEVQIDARQLTEGH